MRCKECGISVRYVQSKIFAITQTCQNCRKKSKEKNSKIVSPILINYSEIQNIIDILKILCGGKLIRFNIYKKMKAKRDNVNKYLNYCIEKQFITTEPPADAKQKYYYVISNKGVKFLENIKQMPEVIIK